ncbi:hypothetical protein Gobs01_04352 [Geodermatophilus obscurus DSM 43160]|uniref:Uncharacterized protein n=1 Tax=Geodermatophilus obscurus (strain ATCC 25078 / DSM 43160 / JCM 3152 / CCUG 61914 / KCC A-0152 / KCTC 9177 / NBRC 13315 / NRRL B-3577 / G-20) TaxID=526225 RepID=D2SDP1_GEOOG|nr:hypothetical protein Gobs_1784 [Geodermatophilus obscurus DSM 43160]
MATTLPAVTPRRAPVTGPTVAERVIVTDPVPP